jgi:hypothetical protein
MKITAILFEAVLKCATKCHLRALGESGSGNEYADWVRAQDETYTREAARRLRETVPESERVIAPPADENLKAAKWRLAVDLVAQASSPASPGSVPLPEATPGAATGESTAVPPAEPPPPTAESASDRSADRRVRAAQPNEPTRGHSGPRSDRRR